MTDDGLVKTKQFNYYKYVGDPVNAVRIFNEKNVDELVLLDINATQQGRAPNLKLLKNIAAQSRMPICYGGGVVDEYMAETLVKLGIERVAIGDAAVRDASVVSRIASAIGSQSTSIILNVKRTGILKNPQVFTGRGAEPVKGNVTDLAQKYESHGAGELIVSSIDRDGMKTGMDMKLLSSIRKKVGIPLTAVGGVSSLADIASVEREIGVCGVSVGAMFIFKGPYDAVLLSYLPRS